MATLPEGFREIVCKSIFSVQGVPMIDFMNNLVLADKVCDRADRLSKAGKLTGSSVSEIASVIYGGWYIWLWYIGHRDLIWKIAILLAELVISAKTTRVVHTTRANG